MICRGCVWGNKINEKQLVCLLPKCARVIYIPKLSECSGREKPNGEQHQANAPTGTIQDERI
ncbi:MAG TPA: hypothetical protein VFH42_00225 [Sporolactobacillaceae bacterium]|nr:hypothetical protein [Sporolactobacillaceae bacterium]